MSNVVRRGAQKVAGQEWARLRQWRGIPGARNNAQRQQRKQRRIPRNFHVEIPESREFYDTPNWKIGVGMVVVALLAKLAMIYDESKEEERTERKARDLAESQGGGGPQIVSQELWEQLQHLRPRTPFESRTARDNARLRIGDAMTLEDVKDWAYDVVVDGLAKKEDSLRR